ncbi:MAG: radical SAM protein [Nitrospinae bacterium]|nr:radical SAM protein [Nitrospinota bacterium]
MKPEAIDRDASFAVRLAYPNTASVGASYLGFHKIFAAFSAVCQCEAAFMPDNGGAGTLNLARCDLAAFSFTFEMDVLNLLRMLKENNIPLMAAERNDRHPLVCAGGIVPTMNPEPFAAFFDFFVLGEGELAIPALVGKLSASRHGSREQRLRDIADIEGVYIPSLYEVEENSDGSIKTRCPLDDAPERVKRLYDPDFGRTGSAQLAGLEGSIFRDSHLIETGKGCGQGCRFCASGFVYRPVRHVDKERLFAQIDEGLAPGGLARKERIGLIGSAICEHPEIGAVYDHILKKGGGINVSSLRVEYLSAETLARLAAGGLKTMTIAPEAGSERLRRAVNKRMTDDDVLGAVRLAADAGILNVKCYFLIGLPGERDEDIAALASLAKRIRDELLAGSKRHGRAGKITVGVNPFVPKPQTPFQWEPVAPLAELKEKSAQLKKALLRESNMELKIEGGKNAAAQGLLSVGGRSVSTLIMRAFEEGGWTAALKTPAAKSAYARRKEFGEALPWDFIDSGVTKKYLQAEAGKAANEKTTPPCPPEHAGCKRCGEFLGNCC